MVDELFERTYESARAQLNRDLLGMFRALRETIGGSMAALNRVEFSAPWANAKTARRA